jgi:hypothetical protein
MQLQVACRTVGCISEAAITLLTDPEPIVICGYCSVEITDKVEVGPAVTELVVVETVADQEMVIDTEQIV